MRIVCVGGGPGGLYYSIATKLRDPSHDVTVVERNPAGVTYGWGVVYWDDLLDSLFATDPRSARAVYANSVVWDGQRVHVGGRKPAYLGGYGHALGRSRLLDILTTRAEELGVDLQFEREVTSLSEYGDADLVVAADGVNSALRHQYADSFGTEVGWARNRYVWLGTHKVFDAFTFGFEPTDAGWVWFHAYAYDDETSTFIVECTRETWQGLGFDRMGRDESTRALERIFERHLDGQPLLTQPHGADGAVRGAEGPEARMPWLTWVQVRNRTWSHGNVVLLGDAAHTTHFTIGSGTRLAIEDAICLADEMHVSSDLTTALPGYTEQRSAALAGWQEEAGRSTRWFEDVESLLDRDPARFGYLLANRREDEGGDGSARGGVDWRYAVYVANQNAALRRVRRALVTSPRRRRRARRRERLGASGVSPGPQPATGTDARPDALHRTSS